MKPSLESECVFTGPSVTCGTCEIACSLFVAVSAMPFTPRLFSHHFSLGVGETHACMRWCHNSRRCTPGDGAHQPLQRVIRQAALLLNFKFGASRIVFR